jgi:3-hydroxybutyrate dehydrogenase
MQATTREPTRAVLTDTVATPTTAIVTGSTSGIGLAIARALAARGNNIVLNGFGEPAAIAATTEEMADAFGVEVIHSPADMSKPTDVVAMVMETLRKFGDVGVLVNNAGILHVGPTESTPEDKWNAIMQINVAAAFHAIRAVLPAMKARGFGRVINLSSALGLVGAANFAAYSASKHAVVGLTKAVALETAELGVTVNAICPGYVLTPLVEREIDEAMRSGPAKREDVIRGILSAVQPTRRFVEASEIGELVAFLCGEHAKSITGAVLSIDGGWTAQ